VADKTKMTTPITTATKPSFATDIFDGLALAETYIIPTTIKPIVAKGMASLPRFVAKALAILSGLLSSAAKVSAGKNETTDEKIEINVFLFT